MIKLDTITLRSADLGTASLVPDIKGEGSVPFFGEGENFKYEMLPDLGKGMVASMLPYTVQNRYDRDIRERDYKAVVLENEHLRAVFLPELGGRLWSLYNKKKKKHLVYENDALCFGNLALRNAWFAGGVEWNIGIKGHSPFTAGPMFTAFEKTEDGRDVLKMYEYETIRGLVYVMRFALDEDRLCVRIEIENVSGSESYMYWWSNIAVAQNEDTRVFVPTDKTYVTSYRDGGYIVSHKSVPVMDGTDRSYPTRSAVATDYFYDIPNESKKWICSLEGDGEGLLQYSSRRMFGRKMFVWGHAQGGSHWNEWLTDGRDYYEIQSGLANTQFEHFRIGAGERISWTEIYTDMKLERNACDGDYFSIVKEINEGVDESLLECPFFATVKDEKTVLLGSGRAALWELIHGRRLSSLCEFPKESVGENELYYADLVSGESKDGYAISYSNDPAAAELIDKKANKTDTDLYLLGICRMACGEYDAAEKALSRVGEGKLRTLSDISLALYHANINNDADTAYGYASRCADSADISVFITYCEIAIRAGRYAECAEIIEGRTDTRAIGRVEMYLAKCYSELGRLDEAESILRGGILIPDIREGEYSLFNIYVELYRRIIEKNEGREGVSDTEVLERYPLPRELDFRLH